LITAVRQAELSIDYTDVHADPNDAVDPLLDARDVRAVPGSLLAWLQSTPAEIFFRERSVAEAPDVLHVPAMASRASSMPRGG
jgi:RNA polymerase sigma-70 factor (ECF subfamily)